MAYKMNGSSMVIAEENYSNVQPVWKFMLLCLISFGIYEIYWSYKNWSMIKERDNLKIFPLARSLFFVFFAYSLFKRLIHMAKEKGYKAVIPPSILAIAYIATSLLYRLPSPYLYISAFAFIPLIPVTQAVNYYWEREQPGRAVRKNFTRGEIIFTVIFGTLFILNVKTLLFS